jgi:hypothetical protein
MQISQTNVGRIAERIVANELEARGFRVSDLNSDGTAANADLLAVSPNLTLQVQVKGSANTDADHPWWVGYGFCSDAIIAKENNESMFNRRSSFYSASHVILVAVRSPKEYLCVVLPVSVAEEAAQLNLDRDYRTLTRQGKPKKPNKVWLELEPRPKARTSERFTKEREISASYRDDQGWEHVLNSAK